jgi:hypothetical protein
MTTTIIAVNIPRTQRASRSASFICLFLAA